MAVAICSKFNCSYAAIEMQISGTARERPNQAKVGVRPYINERLGATKLGPLTAKTGVRVP
jgi:hypothetical protein